MTHNALWKTFTVIITKSKRSMGSLTDYFKETNAVQTNSVKAEPSQTTGVCIKQNKSVLLKFSTD